MDRMDLASMMKEVMERNGGEKVKVGFVSPHVLHRFNAWKKAQDDLEHEIEIEKLNVEKMIKDKYGDRIGQNLMKHKALWKEIETELKLPDNLSLSLNNITGEVMSQGEKKSIPDFPFPFPPL